MGCKGLFAGCGGPERTPRHQRVKESEAEGCCDTLKIRHPYEPLGASLAGNPSCLGFLKALVREKLRKGHRRENQSRAVPPPPPFFSPHSQQLSCCCLYTPFCTFHFQIICPDSGIEDEGIGDYEGASKGFSGRICQCSH